MRRARQPEQKEDRKRDILNAALHCFMANKHQLPSAADVAKQAGIAKGTVYLYFKTKEEIFLALMTEQLEQVFASLTTGSESTHAAKHLCECIIHYIQKHPEFMPLASMLYSVLEANIPVDVLFGFKVSLSAGLTQTAEYIDQRFSLPTGFSQTALLQSYATLVGLWQMLAWPPVLDQHRDRPEFAALQFNFDQQLQQVLHKIWTRQ